MMLVDDHCHLTHELYKKELDAVLERAKKAGVKAIICSGVNVPTNRECLALAKKYAPLVRCSLGIYPTDAVGAGADEAGLARQIEPFDVDKELKFIAGKKDEIAAIGECGLDYHWVTDPEMHKKMKINFEKVLAVAEKIKKPVVVHTRKAEADCLDMLESSNVKKVVLHCFMGRKHLVKRAADLGYTFSIPAIIAKLKHFQMVAEIANINQILTETDGPWLSPVPGRHSEPADVALAVKYIAQVKDFTEEEVANNIFMNYQRVYE